MSKNIKEEPIAVVVNNNQDGWKNIVETKPNVTLNIGTELFLHPAKKEEEKKKTLWELLSAPISDEKAIQRSDGNKTGKGYDTTGYGYQWLVNRFNEVLGIGGWEWHFVEAKEDRIEGNFKSGAKFYEITGEATIVLFANEKLGLMKDISHTETGGHKSSTIADARKGASTNAFKKTAGFFGVGKQAFEKNIDEDNRDGVVEKGDVAKTPKTQKTVQSVIEEIKKCKTPAHIEKFRAWISGCSYTQEQKNVMMRNLEEIEKKITKV